jgi:hypothetical protein
MCLFFCGWNLDGNLDSLVNHNGIEAHPTPFLMPIPPLRHLTNNFNYWVCFFLHKVGM